jgi:exodeoxyribonuclease VII large subunit
LTQGIQIKLMRERQRLHRFKESPLFREPAAAVRIRQQRLDDLTQRLERNMTTQLREYRQRFTDLAAKLQTMNPQKTLERGYAVLLDRPTRDIIMSHTAVIPEQALTVKLYDGEINVIATDNQENSAP